MKKNKKLIYLSFLFFFIYFLLNHIVLHRFFEIPLFLSIFFLLYCFIRIVVDIIIIQIKGKNEKKRFGNIVEEIAQKDNLKIFKIINAACVTVIILILLNCLIFKVNIDQYYNSLIIFLALLFLANPILLYLEAREKILNYYHIVNDLNVNLGIKRKEIFIGMIIGLITIAVFYFILLSF